MGRSGYNSREGRGGEGRDGRVQLKGLSRNVSARAKALLKARIPGTCGVNPLAESRFACGRKTPRGTEVLESNILVVEQQNLVKVFDSRELDS